MHQSHDHNMGDEDGLCIRTMVKERQARELCTVRRRKRE